MQATILGPDSLAAEKDPSSSAGGEPEAIRFGMPASLDEPALNKLVTRIVDQDQSAFAALYEQSAGRVFGFVLRLVRQESLAEEVTEDVFWQVWRQAPRFNPDKGCVLAWIMNMARSRALDRLRQSEPLEIIDETAITEATTDETDGTTPFDLLAALDEKHLLHAAIARLEPLPRQLLALAFFKGFSHEEIAEHCGLALGTVKSHIRRTLLNLREQLAHPIGRIPA